MLDGSIAYFNNYWLRDNCPTSFDSQTRERTFDIFHEAEAPKPAKATIQDEALVIEWAGSGHVTRHALSFLALYAKGARSVMTPPTCARAGIPITIPPLPASRSRAEGRQDPRRKWIEAMLVEGVAIITDMPDSNEGLDDLVKLMGHVRPTFFGEYFDVRTHIKPTNLAYTAKGARNAHRYASRRRGAGVQFLHCRANSVSGGQNLFSTAWLWPTTSRRNSRKTSRCCRHRYPLLLRARPLRHAVAPAVIELDQHGEVSGVTISQHMADIFDLPQQFLDTYYRLSAASAACCSRTNI